MFLNTGYNRECRPGAEKRGHHKKTRQRKTRGFLPKCSHELLGVEIGQRLLPVFHVIVF
jgi:hypothetical protein